MTRLIDADAFLKDILTAGIGKTIIEYSESDIGYMIRKRPTIDAVPVVRCRECKHWKQFGSKAGNSFSDMEYIGGCEFTKYCRRESDFCSYGERKEGAD
ncbi:MAG: hypothetical protein SPJ86_01395 [Eubacteriales bacterium]|nr:hypothetical protein [Eubacteriales bacterium]